jgi:hypothetical protein
LWIGVIGVWEKQECPKKRKSPRYFEETFFFHDLKVTRSNTAM